MQDAAVLFVKLPFYQKQKYHFFFVNAKEHMYNRVFLKGKIELCLLISPVQTPHYYHIHGKFNREK
jgi:hypothetical protein